TGRCTDRGLVRPAGDRNGADSPSHQQHPRGDAAEPLLLQAGGAGGDGPEQARQPAGGHGRWRATRGGGPRMTRDELAARLLHTFLEELDEQVRVLNAELLALEREGASAQRLGAVFRVAHTLKGAARATRLTPIEELCHAMEGPLAGAQSGARGLREEDFQLLFEAADALSSAG